MRTIAIANQKGGCGKTTTAINLAVALALKGNRVVIVDLDPQACATQALHGEPDAARATVYHPLVNSQISMSQVAVRTSVDNLDLVPSNVTLAGAEMELFGRSGRELRLAQAFKAVRDEYQVCVIDCPPSLGMLTLNALVASTDVIVPIQVDSYALKCAQRLLETVLIVRQRFHQYCAGNLKILLTCVEDRTALGRRIQQQMRELFGNLVLRTTIHRTVTMAEALAVGQSALTYAPTSAAAAEYTKLAEELVVEAGEPVKAEALMEMAAMAQSALASRESELARPSALAPCPSPDVPDELPLQDNPPAPVPEEPPIVQRRAPSTEPPQPVAPEEVPAEPFVIVGRQRLFWETGEGSASGGLAAGLSSMIQRAESQKRPPESGTGEATPTDFQGRELPIALRPHRRPPVVRSRHRARKVILSLLVLIALGAVAVGILYGFGMMNKPPIASAGKVMAQEDSPLPIVLTGTDRDNDPLTYRVVQGPSHGELQQTTSGVVYKAAPNYNGADNFTFVAGDGKATSGPATVSIVVAPTNDAPVVAPLSTKVENNKSTTLTLAASDIDGDPLTFGLVDWPQHGTLALGPQFARDGELVYTPRGGYTGPDSFTFQVSDGMMNSGPVPVSMTVVRVNSAPVAGDGEAATEEDVPVSITLAASDVDKDALTYAVTKNPENGTLDGAAPKLRYTPKPNFSGTDTFTYEVRDSQGGTTVASMNIAVAPANDPPSIQSEPPVTGASVARRYVYEVSAADPDAGDVLTYSLAEKPEGMVIDSTSGRIQWTPTDAQMGTHAIVVEVSDSGATPASVRQSFDLAVTPPAPQKTILAVSGGFDQKTQKPLPTGDSRLRANDDQVCQIDAGFSTLFDFADAPIPADAKITSVVLYVNHYEEQQFTSGKLEWRIGMGWPGSSTTWASMTPSVYDGQRNKGTIIWDIKGAVSTPEKIAKLQLQVKNNCTSPRKATFIDHAYVVVLWQ